jgi:hypothetical protein
MWTVKQIQVPQRNFHEVMVVFEDSQGNG